MPDRILKYFRKHKLLIEENLSLCEDPDNIEAIHNLRLSIKRLRVVARLAELISDHAFNKKDQLRNINRLFKRAGRLRDVQVTGQLLSDFQSAALDPAIQKLKQREARQRRKFEKALALFDKDTLHDFETGLLEALKGTSGKHVLHTGLHLLSDMEMDIHEIFHSSRNEKRLHDIRTRLKDINYLNNIFDEALPVHDHLNISVERLRELGEIAGAWHDSLNLEVKLGKFIRKHPAEVTPESLLKIVSELKTKKQGLLQEYSCILLNEIKV